MMRTGHMQHDGFYEVRQRARLRASLELLREIGAETDCAARLLRRRQRNVIPWCVVESSSRSA